MEKIDLLDHIGNTPMVRIKKLNQNPLATILAKLEFPNPSGSIKDRIAKYMIEDAEKNGLLLPGGTIVEATSGNMGLSLAMVGAVKGYPVILVMPDKVSDEKINLPKAFGAKVIVTKTDVPADSPENYYQIGKRIAQETPKSFFVNQYNNPKNPEAHYMLTGPEIWEQTGGVIDYLVAGAGTGGTISGVAKYLKERKPSIQVIGVDPYGSIFTDYFKNGTMVQPHVYKVEGIGEDMLVKALDLTLIDDFIQVSDANAFRTARSLARLEGIFSGGSSGAALWAAQQIAKKVTEPKTIVAIFPDSGYRYLSKMYDDTWMKSNGFIN